MTKHLLHTRKYFAAFLCFLFFAVCLLTFPIQTIVQAGSYSATLTVANSSGSKSVNQKITVTPEAAGYYIDTNNPSASDSNPGTAALPWKTITKANQTLVAGDTVFIKAGNYTTYIAPQNSGNASSRITYKNCGSDIVTVQNASYGIWINGKSYITVQGINFYDLDKFMYLANGANYNIIAYCNFDQGRNIGWSGSRIYGNSSYNWVHHCQFSKYGYYTDDDIGCILDIGTAEITTDLTSHNLIEDNIMFHGGHHVLGVFGMYNVIRNNYFHNEPWSMGTADADRGAIMYGDRNIGTDGYIETSGRNLFEGNQIGYSADPPDNVGASGMALNTSYNIVRFNRFYHNDRAGLSMSLTSSYISDIVYNKVYNNTFFHNGINTQDPIDHMNSGIGFGIYSGTHIIKYNAFKNNLLYKHRVPYGTYYVSLGDQIFAGNWDGDTQGNPLFANASVVLADPMDSSVPDLHLTSSSPCKDSGTYLTTITSLSGSGTIFQVADAGYFMDGWGISGVDGDEIQIVGTSLKARIINVNYGTNTITVNTPLTWTQNQGVALAYVDAAPDAGAYEFGNTKVDFNQDGQEDILWRYYGPGGYNYVWYMGTAGSGITGLQAMNSGVINMFQAPPLEKVYWDAREAGGFLNRTADRVYRDAREVGDPLNRTMDKVYWDARDAEGFLNEPMNKVYRDPREAEGFRSLHGASPIRWNGFGSLEQKKEKKILISPMENMIGLLGIPFVGGANLPAVSDLNWQIAGTGDFNGDGKVDILWRYNGPGGYNCVWFMNGTTVIGGAVLPACSDLSWQIAGTGDFSGDGKVDILWRCYGSGGYNCVWFMNGTTLTGGTVLPACSDLSWQIAGTGDFNGDGKVDILWRYYGSGGYNCVWFMNGTTLTGGTVLPACSDLNWQIGGIGDFNGDGKVDILWRYYWPGGYNCVWFMNGTTLTGGADLPACSDLNWRIVNH